MLVLSTFSFSLPPSARALPWLEPPPELVGLGREFSPDRTSRAEAKSLARIIIDSIAVAEDGNPETERGQPSTLAVATATSSVNIRELIAADSAAHQWVTAGAEFGTGQAGPAGRA